MRREKGESPIVQGSLISIVIPVLNEEKIIEKCLSQFEHQTPPFEIIVVDGGSSDKTKQLVRSFKSVKLLNSELGRGKQLNIGSRIASGRILLFLHADTLLPRNGLTLIRETVMGAEIVGGYFRLEHDESSLVYRRLSFLFNWRSIIPSATPYGDQAVFCSREAFDKLGGFKEIPLMEDYDLSVRLRRLGKMARIDEPVITSFRRYKSGSISYALQCNLLKLLYHIGVSPYLLKRFYKDVR